MKKDTKKFAVGTLIAAVAGFAAGILTAPKSGKETRKDIKDVAVKTTKEAENKLKQLHTELNDLIDEATEKGKEFQGKAKDQYQEAVDKSKVAKQKAREILSAVHEGDAEDKDLQDAIKEASNAVKHLKSYIKK